MNHRYAILLIIFMALLALFGCGLFTYSPKTTTDRDPALRILSFSGYEWWVKQASVEAVGPGPNYFSNSSENVWVDSDGFLHLKITHQNGKWNCAEVSLFDSLGYGKYIFYLASRVDQLDKNVVLGLFTWSDNAEYNHREIDIEFARWGSNSAKYLNYTVQPYTREGNTKTFNSTLNAIYSTHYFIWKNTNVSFESIQGTNATVPDSSYTIGSWDYNGSDIPLPGNENVRFNLWLNNGNPPSDSNEEEVVVKKFEFVP